MADFHYQQGKLEPITLNNGFSSIQDSMKIISTIINAANRRATNIYLI